MKIATYNLLTGGNTRQHWATMLHEQQVTLLLVQESFSPDEHLPPLLHPQARSQSVWESVAGRHWGSGIHSTQGKVTQVPVPDFEGWVCGAEVENLPGHSEPLLVFSLHAPKGNSNYQKVVNNILDRILGLVHGRQLIIGGDFNLAISKSHDPADPVSKQDSAIQARLSDDFGLINCWQTKHPDVPPAQTLRWNNAPTNPYHCDGIFVPATWRDRLQSCEILSGETWNELSDHNPVVATFG